MKWVVYEEPHLLTTEKELKKPDLIFVKEEIALVVDVTVRFKYMEKVFEDAAAEKVRHYKDLTNQIKELTGAKEIEYFGFPLGARGKWPKINEKVLTALGMPDYQQKRTAKCFSKRNLLYSIDVINTFESIGKNNKNTAP